MPFKSSTGIKIAPFLFILPFFLHQAVFNLYPTIYGFWISLYSGVSKLTFVWFQNYAYVLEDERFWKSMLNGVKLTCGSLFIVLPIALGVALLINQPFVERRKGMFATFFFTPNITSAVAVAIVFSFIYNREIGILNSFLGLFGVESIAWLESPKWTIPALIIMVTWRYLGINILYFLAGLQNIPHELIEAAKIDGANAIQRLWHITLPLLRPIMTFIVFQAIIGSFSMFAEAYLLANNGGGPNDSLLFPTMYMYEQAFRFQKFGYSSAIGYVFTLILLIVGLIQIKLFQEQDDRR
ncbi:carbohydrate ABC transporter permease [Paenibacillus mendelii]|uniref:Carbohydrate ABC transporter permease n=1 Tax=Paenibacillus mendelii TaxID=206163 RepID=A0ABV6J325_9BACL|nr:sugar ABC transporter permease [Paenibacillus mendelii]MCQ6559374.1 sugar ABC transporter permease [Paenibacillus mendelii]